MKIKSPGTVLHTNTETQVKPSVITPDNTPPDTIEWCQCRCYERVMRCCDCHQKIDTTCPNTVTTRVIGGVSFVPRVMKNTKMIQT